MKGITRKHQAIIIFVFFLWKIIVWKTNIVVKRFMWKCGLKDYLCILHLFFITASASQSDLYNLSEYLTPMYLNAFSHAKSQEECFSKYKGYDSWKSQGCH